MPTTFFRYKSITQTKADRYSACIFKLFFYDLASRKAYCETGFHVGYEVVQDAKQKAIAAQMDAN